MKKSTTILLAVMAAAALSCQKTDNDDSKFHPSEPESLPDKPEVVIKDGALYVNGESFFIKGAALNGDNLDSDKNQEFWKEAKQSGANTVRMYSVNDEAEDLLDEMAKKGVYVNLGLWMPRECEGFDYNDETARKKQVASVKTIVSRLKNHPAILMWCIGNELDQNNKVDGTGSINLNVNVWKDVNEISQYI
ncbi:MAG: glycoside hydrolase family 2 TIM barrel-domain containing protein, partial [Candidatus Cryptobacteroides sp.]